MKKNTRNHTYASWLSSRMMGGITFQYSQNLIWCLKSKVSFFRVQTFFFCFFRKVLAVEWTNAGRSNTNPNLNVNLNLDVNLNLNFNPNSNLKLNFVSWILGNFLFFNPFFVVSFAFHTHWTLKFYVAKISLC